MNSKHIITLLALCLLVGFVSAETFGYGRTIKPDPEENNFSGLFTDLNFTGTTGFDDFFDNASGEGKTHLSNFTDDLGNRGYTHLTNFTDDLGHIEDNSSWNQSLADSLYYDNNNPLNFINSSGETDPHAYNGTLAYNSSLKDYRLLTNNTFTETATFTNLIAGWNVSSTGGSSCYMKPTTFGFLGEHMTQYCKQPSGGPYGAIFGGMNIFGSGGANAPQLTFVDDQNPLNVFWAMQLNNNTKTLKLFSLFGFDTFAVPEIIDNTGGLIINSNITNPITGYSIDVNNHTHESNKTGGIIPHTSIATGHALDQSYTNNGSRWEIHRVSIEYQHNGAGDIAYTNTYVNGVIHSEDGMINDQNFAGESQDWVESHTFNVPPNGTYSINTSIGGGGNILLKYWWKDDR